MQKLNLVNYRNRHCIKNKVIRTCWRLCWVLIFSWMPTGFSLSWLVRMSLLRLFGAKIGKNSSVHGSAKIWMPSNLKIGDNSTIGDRVDCYCVDAIEIGSQVTISQDAFLCTASHDISTPTMELKTAPIRIFDQCWICARAIILPGVILSEGAVVAAGAVVSRNVPPWTIVGGNPAKKIGDRLIKESVRT